MQLSKNGAEPKERKYVIGIQYEYDTKQCKCIRTQWSINQDCVVELSRGRCDVNGFHLLKTSQRMAFGDQFGDGPLVERSRDQQDDVIDHIAVSDEIKEGRQLAA